MQDAYSSAELRAQAASWPAALGRVTVLTDQKPDELLDAAAMHLLVRRAQRIMSGFYVHLQQKRVLHAANPERRLEILEQRVQEQLDHEHVDNATLRLFPRSPASTAQAPPPITAAQFHDEMTRIFTSVRDLHTIYLLPDAYRRRIAFLPFLVEECVTDDGSPSYLVTKVAFAPPRHPAFAPGAVVTHWNGVPIARAVDANAGINGGAGVEARRARGVQLLTLRWLGLSPQPLEDWVVVTFKAGGRTRELRFPWLVVERPERRRRRDGPRAGRSQTLVVDHEGRWIGWVKARLYGPARRPGVLRSRVIDGFGYLRIFSFDVDDVGAFVARVADTVAHLPQDGLIIDIRGNPGGDMLAAERLLQLFTPKTITPQRLEFRNQRAAVTLAQDYYGALDADAAGAGAVGAHSSERFQAGLVEATTTGAPFVASVPVAEDACNAIGQIYQGPVVLIVDALSYSASDAFAAGFQDHAIGTILGTSRTTGAGGGNVWTDADVFETYASDGAQRPAFPPGSGFALALRRTLRVGERAGVAVEDAGVVVDQRQPPTRRDLLEDNADLLATATAILAANSFRRYRLAARYAGTQRRFDVTASENLARVDVTVDGRPLGSLDPRAQESLTVPGAVEPRTAQFLGYADGVPDEPAVAVRWRSEHGAAEGNGRVAELAEPGE